MAKLMSKSELIQKIAERHPNNMTPKDVKGVIESLAEIGYKELKKTGAFFCARICQIRCHQEARYKGAERHQSVHKGANNI
jgi:hypothetical protein